MALYVACYLYLFMCCRRPMCVHAILFRFRGIGKELLSRFSVCSPCILSICNFSYFLVWFRGQDIGTGCANFGHCLSFIFLCYDGKLFVNHLELRIRCLLVADGRYGYPRDFVLLLLASVCK